MGITVLMSLFKFQSGIIDRVTQEDWLYYSDAHNNSYAACPNSAADQLQMRLYTMLSISDMKHFDGGHHDRCATSRRVHPLIAS